MSNKLAVSILLAEYKEVKQEVRDQISSMDVNMRTGLIFVGAFIAAAAQLNIDWPIYLLPSLIFFFSLIHALKTSSMNNLGTYIQFLDIKIKELVDKDKIGMCWEGYYLWEKQTQPSGNVVKSIAILYSFWILIFVTITFASYKSMPWTIVINSIETIISFIFVWKVLRENTIEARQANIKKLEESINI